MSFTSIDFYYFLALVLASSLVFPPRLVWVPLLAASYVFYAAFQWLGLLFLIGQTLIIYGATLFIARSTGARRTLGLSAGLIPVLGMLVVVKYADFAGRSLAQVFGSNALTNEASAISRFTPLGLSFFTLANAGYLVDVWKGRVPVERHLGRLALFGAFFPQVVSGPIPRAGELLPQFALPARAGLNLSDTPQESRLGTGAVLILWGLFKKLVIADRLALYVNPVFADPHAWNGATLALASLFFTFQIYCDFSGYTDIAIGAARILGIDLMLNFRQPYFSRSIGEFWRRWHISLSTWFRDYVYIPMGGNRVLLIRWILNVLLVFVVSGLWHGANWTYIVWGGLHGIYLVFERLTSRWREMAWRFTRLQRLRPAVSCAVTFLLVYVAWIFFRSATVHDAGYIVGQLRFALAGRPWPGDSQLTTATSLAVILVLIAVEAVQVSDLRSGQPLPPFSWPLPARWAAYICLILSIFLLGVSSNGFIYGKF